MTKEEFITKFYSSDNEEQFLKDVYNNLNCLEQQLEYLRSGEYLNQLKFERNMLEDIVQNGEVSKEDKEFIDMTHRNTELLEENNRLKAELELHKGTLKREHEAIHKVNDLEDKIEKAIELLKKYGIVDELGNFNAYLDTIELKEILKMLKGE